MQKATIGFIAGFEIFDVVCSHLLSEKELLIL